MSETIELRNQAYVDYQQGMKYKEIAVKYGVSLSAVKSWAIRYWKQKGCDHEKKKLQPPKKKVATRGAPIGNQNAIGNSGGAPLGNKNAVTHGTYETVYLQALPDEERAIFNSIPDSVELDGEIRLLRLKLSRLIGRREITVYDMDGYAHKRNITEAEREKGILEVTAEIRKLVKTKKQLELAEKTGLDEEEQKARIAQIKAQTDKLTGNNQEIEDMEEIEGDIYGSSK